MSTWVEWIVDGILRGSLGIIASALLVMVVVRVLRLKAPRAESIAWALVMTQGILWTPVIAPIPVHWVSAAQQDRTIDLSGSADSEPATVSNQSGSVAVQTTSLERDHVTPTNSSVPSASARQTYSAPSEPESVQQTRWFSWQVAALSVWLVGMVGIVTLGLVRYRCVARQIQLRSQPPSEWEVGWRGLLKENGITSRIPLAVTTDAGPALCRMPTSYWLLVPHSLCLQLGHEQLLAVFRHELAHYQRRDIWKASLARGVTLLHWFNPLAWYALSRFEAQLEFACDRKASADDPTLLAGTLVRIGAAGTRYRPALAQSAGSNSLVERVQRLLDDTPTAPRWKKVALVTLTTATILAMGFRLRVAAEGQVAEPVSTPRTIGLSDADQTLQPLMQLGTDSFRTREWISGIAFSPNGELIAAAPSNGSTPRARIFDVKTGRQRELLLLSGKPEGYATCVAFSPDQTRLVWGEVTGFVALWDVPGKRPLFRERLHRGRVNDVAFSSSGGLIASAGDDGVVHVRSTSNPEEPHEAFAVGNQTPNVFGSSTVGLSGASCLAFSPDDTLLAAGSGAKANILIWRTKDGELLREIKSAHGTRGGSSNPALNCLHFTPNGEQLMSAGQTMRPISETSLAFGSAQVTVSEVRFWDVATGRRVRELPIPEAYGFGFAALSQDGRRVAVGDFSRLHIVDVDTGDVVQTTHLPGSWGRPPAFSPDGQLVAMPLRNSVAMFNATTGKRLHHDDDTPVGSVSSAAWSPNGQRLITGHADGYMRAWDLESGDLLWRQLFSRVISRSGWSAKPAFMSFSPDGRLVVVAGRRDDPKEYKDGIVALLNAKSGQVLREFHLNEVRHAALSPDGKVLVAATSNGGLGDTRLHGIRVLSGETLYTTPPPEVQAGLWQVKAMQFRPGSMQLEIAQSNGDINRFDALAGKELRLVVADWRSAEQRQKDRPRRHNLCWEAALSPDATTLVTSAAEYVYVWDVESAELKYRIRHPHKGGCRIKISPDGRILAASDRQTAGDYGSDTILLFDLETGKLTGKAKPDDNRAAVLAFTPDGTKLFGGFYRGSATVWSLAR